MQNTLSFDKIICPKCNEEIQVSETLIKQFTAKVTADADQKIREAEKAFSEKQKMLIAKEQELIASKSQIDSLVDEKLKVRIKDQERKIQDETRKEFMIQIEDMKQQAESQNRKLEEAQRAQLEAIKMKRDLEEKAKTIELEIEKKLDTERYKLKEDAERKLREEYLLKDAEKEKKLQDVLKINEELKRKIEQGSQQTQGEVKELQIEELLRSAFPLDQIIPVAKGVRGADAVQKVFSNYGNHCGTIIWECKRTKAWSDGWISKLKEDQMEAKAEIAVIISDVLPKDCQNFAHIDGVWVTSNNLVKELASALRMQLTQVALIKASNIGKNEKMESLYNYLTGPSFSHKIQGIMATFMEMKQDIEREKNAYKRMWAKREKEIDRVLNNTTGMYGDMQGVLGNELTNISALELPESELSTDIKRPELNNASSGDINILEAEQPKLDF